MPWTEMLPSGKYRACWRDAMGKQRSRAGFKTKAAAMRHAGEQELAAREGKGAWGGRAPRWDEWRDVWLSLRRVEPATARQDSVRINRYLTPRWGSTRLNQIRRAQVQEWVNELAKQTAHNSDRALSPSTVDRILRLFSASLKAAVLDERTPLVQNPCTGVKLPAAAPGHERFLTHAEVERVAFYLDGHYWAAWLLLCHTGLRFGELAGLHWQRVDLDNGLIHVVETWDAADRAIKAYPKSRKGRSVPIDDTAGDVLAGLLEREPRAGEPCTLPHRGGAKCRSGLVVHTPSYTPLDGHNFGQREFASAVAAAGVGPLRLHDARHTFASWLVQAGVRLEEVQRLLGHASLLTTTRYAHLGTTQNEAVLDALNRSNRG